ncbi:hypothetical protein A1QO_02680 [Vibrio genomosp. F10 str. ZF-129]|uniref:Uncharacterized protein n=1 Tax=Vibrio genomosp. F10 str. ZF-129 TaxID=1187848 RepID=A0A1E5BKA4_9VIBR|nr:hypothetical protein [Vibrio genomosp. F10]OEE38303.1 hypothetical protein A1QO_02680 [Vibrio genomosp. F10 str. ZF-129]
MHKLAMIYQGKRPLINSCNPVLNRRVGLSIEPVHPNIGANQFCCGLSIEVPSINTDSSGNNTRLDDLDTSAVKCLSSAIEKIGAQIEELKGHQERLALELAKFQSGEINLKELALKQIEDNYSDHPLNKVGEKS